MKWLFLGCFRGQQRHHQRGLSNTPGQGATVETPTNTSTTRERYNYVQDQGSLSQHNTTQAGQDLRIGIHANASPASLLSSSSAQLPAHINERTWPLSSATQIGDSAAPQPLPTDPTIPNRSGPAHALGAGPSGPGPPTSLAPSALNPIPATAPAPPLPLLPPPSARPTFQLRASLDICPEALLLGSPVMMLSDGSSSGHSSALAVRGGGAAALALGTSGDYTTTTSSSGGGAATAAATAAVAGWPAACGGGGSRPLVVSRALRGRGSLDALVMFGALVRAVDEAGVAAAAAAAAAAGMATEAGGLAVLPAGRLERIESGDLPPGGEDPHQQQQQIQELQQQQGFELSDGDGGSFASPFAAAAALAAADAAAAAEAAAAPADGLTGPAGLTSSLPVAAASSENDSIWGASVDHHLVAGGRARDRPPKQQGYQPQPLSVLPDDSPQRMMQLLLSLMTRSANLNTYGDAMTAVDGGGGSGGGGAAAVWQHGDAARHVSSAAAAAAALDDREEAEDRHPGGAVARGNDGGVGGDGNTRRSRMFRRSSWDAVQGPSDDAFAVAALAAAAAAGLLSPRDAAGGSGGGGGGGDASGPGSCRNSSGTAAARLPIASGGVGGGSLRHLDSAGLGSLLAGALSRQLSRQLSLGAHSHSLSHSHLPNSASATSLARLATGSGSIRDVLSRIHQHQVQQHEPSRRTPSSSGSCWSAHTGLASLFDAHLTAALRHTGAVRTFKRALVGTSGGPSAVASGAGRGGGLSRSLSLSQRTSAASASAASIGSQLTGSLARLDTPTALFSGPFSGPMGRQQQHPQRASLQHHPPHPDSHNALYPRNQRRRNAQTTNGYTSLAHPSLGVLLGAAATSSPFTSGATAFITTE
ncbi:hypothetical protein Agub_g12045, partial [Astrephomene gubernaculifera]